MNILVEFFLLAITLNIQLVKPNQHNIKHHSNSVNKQ